jgi:HEAT repeat protein
MMNKIRVTLSIIILVICCIDGFAQDSQSPEQEKIGQVINKLWSLRYGGWGSLSEPLKELGDTIIEPLIKKLRDEDMSEWSQYKIEWHQRRIAWALGTVGTERAVDLLIEMVQDRKLHDFGRYEAARALRRIKPEKAVEPLIKVLEDKESNPPPR